MTPVEIDDYVFSLRLQPSVVLSSYLGWSLVVLGAFSPILTSLSFWAHSVEHFWALQLPMQTEVPTDWLALDGVFCQPVWLQAGSVGSLCLQEQPLDHLRAISFASCPATVPSLSRWAAPCWNVCLKHRSYLEQVQAWPSAACQLGCGTDFDTSWALVQ